MSRPFLLLGLAGPANSGRKTVAGYLAETHGLMPLTLPAPVFGPLPAAERRIAELRAAPGHLHIAGAVITNLHAETEAAWLRAQGGVLMHLFRPSVARLSFEELAGRERGDLLIWNTGTRLQLFDQVCEVVDRLLRAAEAA